MEKNENDIMTFRNHKGETYQMKVGEFRNAARDKKNQERDHRPVTESVIHTVDGPVKQTVTPEDRKFQLTHIGGKEW